MATLITAKAVVLVDRVLENAFLLVEDGRISVVSETLPSSNVMRSVQCSLEADIGAFRPALASSRLLTLAAQSLPA